MQFIGILVTLLFLTFASLLASAPAHDHATDPGMDVIAVDSHTAFAGHCAAHAGTDNAAPDTHCSTAGGLALIGTASGPPRIADGEAPQDNGSQMVTKADIDGVKRPPRHS